MVLIMQKKFLQVIYNNNNNITIIIINIATTFCSFFRSYPLRWSWFWDVLANEENKQNFLLGQKHSHLINCARSKCMQEIFLSTVAGSNRMHLGQDHPKQVYTPCLVHQN